MIKVQREGMEFVGAAPCGRPAAGRHKAIPLQIFLNAG